MLLLALYKRNRNVQCVVFTISTPLISLAKYLDIPYYFGYQYGLSNNNLMIFMIRHNQFYMPKVNGMLAHLHTDFKSDYYCFINSDILLSSNIFSILDYVDDQISRGIVSPIVCLYKCLVNDWIQFISYHIISYHIIGYNCWCGTRCQITFIDWRSIITWRSIIWIYGNPLKQVEWAVKKISKLL